MWRQPGFHCGHPVGDAEGNIAPALLGKSEYRLDELARISRCQVHHDDVVRFQRGVF